MDIEELETEEPLLRLFAITSDEPISGVDAMSFYKACGHPMANNDDTIAEVNSTQLGAGTKHIVAVRYRDIPSMGLPDTDTMEESRGLR